MTRRHPGLEAARAAFAREMALASRSGDPRLERVFALVPREAFLPPGPWRIWEDGKAVATPDDNPAALYRNVLVALDEAKGINNGEPFLHAAWIGAADPAPGETVVHVGAGTGYYSALLSMLVRPGGRVTAFEIEPALAERAGVHLAPFDNVTVCRGDVTTEAPPGADLVHVCAGVACPPLGWLTALRPGGRLIFPWRPADDVGLGVLVQRRPEGLAATPLSAAWFIPCVGASDRSGCSKVPSWAEAMSIRSLRLRTRQAPDSTAVAIYSDVWFSAATPAA